LQNHFTSFSLEWQTSQTGTTATYGVAMVTGDIVQCSHHLMNCVQETISDLHLLKYNLKELLILCNIS